MPLSKEAAENKKRYSIDYAKSHYKRIPLDMQMDKYEELKNAAERVGETVTGFIKSAIEQRIKSGK